MDGQNLYKSCERIFGHPLCHPHLLAEILAGGGPYIPLPAASTRVGRARMSPGEARKARNLDRRLEAMRQVGVTVVTRPLRYHWKWGYEEDLPIPMPGLRPRTVTLCPRRRPQARRFRRLWGAAKSLRRGLLGVLIRAGRVAEGWRGGRGDPSPRPLPAPAGEQIPSEAHSG